MSFLRTLLFTTTLLIFALTGHAQQNMSFLGQKTYNEELSDIWGYVDGTGKEYALVGLNTGIEIVDVSNPTSPQNLQYLQGPGGGSTYWWDIKTWGHYAYVINEDGGGLMIVDLSNLPGTVTSSSWTTGNYQTAHNIFIDENGIGYIVGMNTANGGVIMIDIAANPTNPPVIGSYTRRYVHDIYVRGDTMWTAEVYEGEFSVVDISDKSNPVVLASHPTSGGTTHNLWLSDDGTTLLTTDEVANGFIEAYDVSDLNNITRLDQFQSSPGQDVIPHNVFYKGNFAYISYYRDGVVLLDATFPDNLIEVGYYDTSPMSGNGFNGAWGVYPYLPSGNILATDIEEGLFILGASPQQASLLDGTVTDSATNLPINAATITLMTTGITDNTSSNGYYATGILQSGLYNVAYSKTGYITHVEQNVLLTNGQRQTVDVALVPTSNTSLTVQVVDSVTSTGISQAKVLVASLSGTPQEYTADANGYVHINTLPLDYYQIYGGQWGHVTNKIEQNIGTNDTVTVKLKEGYYDDFIFDFNWTGTSTASSGDWERATPIGTEYNVDACAPGTDAQGDFRDKAYVTGNNPGNNAGSNDIDGGTVTLTSPVFDLSGYTNPVLRYKRWFYNGGGSSTPNDDMVISISDGVSLNPYVLETVNNNTSPGANNWTGEIFILDSILTPTANMQLTIEASDYNPGHLVEGGFDMFEIFDSIPPAQKPVASFTLSVDTICPNTPLQITDNSTNDPISWHWSFPGAVPDSSNQQNPTIVYQQPGTYNIELIATNSLGDDTLMQSSVITVLPTPDPMATITAPSCVGSSDAGIVISNASAIQIVTYSWGTGETSNTLSNLSAGNFTLTVTGSNGCTKQMTVTVSDPAPININFAITNASAGGATDGSVTAQVNGGSAPYSYAWSAAMDDTATIGSLAADTYSLSVTDANGCTKTQNFTVGISTGIGQPGASVDFELFPNPFTESVSIHNPADATKALDIVVYNSNGVFLESFTVKAGTTLQFGADLPAGVYFITTRSSLNLLQAKKLVKY